MSVSVCVCSFYPLDFEIDMEGKKFEWEVCIVYLSLSLSISLSIYLYLRGWFLALPLFLTANEYESDFLYTAHPWFVCLPPAISLTRARARTLSLSL